VSSPDPARVRARLLRWYRSHARDFFWRDGPAAAPLTPFQVLLTEFLLWKTSARAEPVILATASPAAVRRLTRAQWEQRLRPLGLQRRRARCLLELARQLEEEHGSAVPTEVEELERLSGVGQYAARATACLLAGSRLMPVDANTARIFARLFAEEPPDRRVPGEAWDARLLAFVPRRVPRRFLWATMDLAAAHCRAGRPLCEGCPLRDECKSRPMFQIRDKGGPGAGA
jgi:A/G-specific adenine glycosylase